MAYCMLTLLPGAAPAAAMPRQSRRARARTGAVAAAALLVAACFACSFFAQRPSAAGPDQGLGFLAPPPSLDAQPQRRNTGASAPAAGVSFETGCSMSAVAGACLLASAAGALARTQQRKKHCTVVRAAGDKAPLESFQVGQEVDGEVTRVANIGVWINIGAEKEALLPKTELKGQVYKPRDKITGLRITEVQAGDSPSTRKIRVSATKDSGNVKVGDVLDAKVSNVAAFGVFFDAGLDRDILVPTKDLADADKDLKEGDKRKVKVLQIDGEGKVSASTDMGRKPPVSTASLKVGDTVNGTVVNITDFGIFLDFGGTKEALARANQLEKGITDYKVGDKIEGLRVADVNLERDQVQLSMRRFPSELNVGDKLEGTVSKVMPYGIFFDAGLAYDVLAPNRALSKQAEEYNEGEVADLTITEIDGNKTTVTTKGESPLDKVIPGSQVSGTVASIAPGIGLFIDVGLGTEALLREAALPKPIEEYKVGDTMTGLAIIRVDAEKEQIEVRDLAGPVLDSGKALSSYKVGDPVDGKVVRIAPFGIFVDIGAERDALYATNQLEMPIGEYKEDMEITGLRVSDVDVNTNRLAVSKKKLAIEFEVGTMVTGKVTKKMNFGCFVDIGASTEALLPNALMDSDVETYSEGQELTNLKITQVQVKGNRLSVGQKERSAGGPSLLDPSEQKDMKDLKAGQKVKGVVRMVREYGVFVDIGLGRKDALLPASQLGGKSTDDFEANQSLEVYIGAVDMSKDRVTLCLNEPPEGGLSIGAASSIQMTDIPKGEMAPDPEFWKALEGSGDDVIDDEPMDWNAWGEKYPGLVKFADQEIEIYLSAKGQGFEGIAEAKQATPHYIPVPVHLRKADAGPPVIPQWKFDDHKMSYDYGIKPEIHVKYMTPPLNNPDWLAPGVSQEDVAKARAALGSKAKST